MSDWNNNAAADSWGSAPAGGETEVKEKTGCRKCGEEGHFAKECEKPDTCFKCKEEGHMSKDCEKPDTCRKCNEEGHMAADCEKPDVCRKCNEEGHMGKDCPTNPDKCRNCNEVGHYASECEKPVTCKRCGEEGHKVSECEKAEETRTVENEDGTTREIYVPKEVADESLFEQGISSGINFDKFDKIETKCSGTDCPKPCSSFEGAGLRSILLENVKKSGYAKPTPIQKIALPCIMAKRDLMGCAQTGSGKTAAFLLPILHALLEADVGPNTGASPQTPQAVIVAPTRELAIQINDEARKFASGSNVKSVVAYGGTSTGFQLNKLFQGCNLLIATPGRLMDFVEKDKVSFSECKFLVLDEADRMLDMGFLPEIQRIVSSAGMPAKGERQTLMFSATFPEEVQHLAYEFLTNYLFLAVGVVGGASSDVVQTIYEVEKFQKRDKLKESLADIGTDRTLVFVETKKNADFLAAFLSGEGLPTTSIHGDRLQREREQALRDFKTGKFPILVATAVAARGLDIKGVAHVINYDMPKTVDEYVHRVGRTGRVGNMGKATSFFDANHDADIAASLIKILTDSQQEVPEFLANASSGMGAGASGFGGTDVRPGAEEEEW